MSAVLNAERRISGPYLEHHADMRPVWTAMSEMVQQRNDMCPPHMRSCFPRFPLPRPNQLVIPFEKQENTAYRTSYGGTAPQRYRPKPRIRLRKTRRKTQRCRDRQRRGRDGALEKFDLVESRFGVSGCGFDDFERDVFLCSGEWEGG